MKYLKYGKEVHYITVLFSHAFITNIECIIYVYKLSQKMNNKRKLTFKHEVIRNSVGSDCPLYSGGNTLNIVFSFRHFTISKILRP